MPKQDEETRAFFESILPDDPRIAVRPMFGHRAGFVNGNMFTGTFGDTVFVRLGDTDRGKLLAIDGSGPFAPMEGRPMAGYVTLPKAWRSDPEQARAWVERSFAWTAALPPKEKKEKKAPR